MKTHKHLKTAAIFSAVICIIMYGIIFFQSIDMMEFQFMLIQLYAAEALLVLTIIFAVCSVLVSRGFADDAKAKKSVIISVIIVIIGYIAFCVGGYLTCYNIYTPEDMIENNEEYVQQFFSLQDTSNGLKGNIDLSVSHIPGTDYITLYKGGVLKSNHQKYVQYSVEYFKSVSPYMNGKFRLERTFPTPLNNDYFPIPAQGDFPIPALGEKMKVDGKTVTAYVCERGYSVMFKSFNRTVYAYILNAHEEDITIEDFAREIIRQAELLDNAVKEKVFLDVPFSEMF